MAVPVSVWLAFGAAAALAAASSGAAPRIDRRALVQRHNPVLRAHDPLSPLSVGNGAFAFTVDITGLQTYPEPHARAMQLGTLSDWGWHSTPNPQGYRLEDALTPYDAGGGRTAPYLDGVDAQRKPRPANDWLRSNPHRMDLGRVGLILRDAAGHDVRIDDLRDIQQTLDLWTGTIDSRFTVDGQPVHVRTVCDPRRDGIAVRIVSPLVAAGRAGAFVTFGYPTGLWEGGADAARPERHTTAIRPVTTGAAIERTVDAERYAARCAWSRGAAMTAAGPHRFEVRAPGHDTLDLSVAFAPKAIRTAPAGFDGAERASAGSWRRFWTTGAAIDLSGSRDPRWRELERRVVLSQYLTAIQCASPTPPQETGLTSNSWYGKFHLEMHWWHAAHFALWGRLPLLERSLPWYERILPAARATAAMQGYRGARWPKMVGPDGRESPSTIGVFLIWQQPHPIYYAELAYRERPRRETLDRYRTLVFETAEFMASYARYDPATKRSILGPPLIPAQELYGNEKAFLINPTYELVYWRWGLETAQRWRERMGMPRNPEWDRVVQSLAMPTVHEGVYATTETPPFSKNRDHPSTLAALGVLPPSPMIDPEIMRRTLHQVQATWQWPTTWGWDYPMIAMTAARLGEPERALTALLIDVQKNRYLPNGHNFQTLPQLPLYLPGNGGLLAAVAMMAGGWDGAPDRPAPGFPADGSWTVRAEGLRRMP